MLTLGGFLLIWLGVRAFFRYTPPGQLPATAPASLIEMKNVTLSGIGDSGRQWLLKADTVSISQDRSLANLGRIKECTIFSKGKPAATLTAQSARYNLWSRTMSVEGGVTVISDSGQKLTAQAFDWDPYTQSLHSRGKVSYTAKSGDVQADSLILYLEKRELALRNPRIALWMNELEKQP